MSEPQRLVPLPATLSRGVAPIFALSAAAACLAGGIALSVAARPHAPRIAPPDELTEADACALPTGLDLAALPERDRSYVARHAIACSDFEHHRISAADYKLALKMLDLASMPPVPPAAPLYATTVREVSSQYTTTSWAATRALGAPDVFPQSGDNANAWASLEADAPTEVLEVGFADAHRLRGLDVFETLNPGAISRVEVITADGAHRTVYDATPHPMSVPAYQRRIDFACTDRPVVAVRVTLGSAAVPGWNEIDAIGATRCD